MFLGFGAGIGLSFFCDGQDFWEYMNVPFELAGRSFCG
jgi:hypothetical protein